MSKCVNFEKKLEFYYMFNYRVFYERGGHTKLFHERGGQIFFITKREANGHLFHEKGGQKALQRLIAQLYLR